MALRAGGGGPGLKGRAHHRPCPIPPPPPGRGCAAARTDNGALRGTSGPAGARLASLRAPSSRPGPARAVTGPSTLCCAVQAAPRRHHPECRPRCTPCDPKERHGYTAAPRRPQPSVRRFRDRQRAQEHLRAPLVPTPLPRHVRAPVGEPAEPPGRDREPPGPTPAHHQHHPAPSPRSGPTPPAGRLRRGAARQPARSAPPHPSRARRAHGAPRRPRQARRAALFSLPPLLPAFTSATNGTCAVRPLRL